MAHSKIGKYTIVRELGRGGMGVVYLGYDEALHRHVAIKVLAPHLAVDKTLAGRFEGEGRAMAKLQHSAIVSVYDAGQEGDEPYIAMEYVEGENLLDYLKRKGPLGPDETARIVAGVASALDYAHAKGVVHRDVKPENTLIARDGSIKVNDFGIAKIVDQTALTQTGGMIGTADYIAPEIWQGQPPSPKSDQYSLGVLTYVLLTGKLPFGGDTFAAKGFAHVNTPVPTVNPTGADALSRGRVNAALSRALSKDPAKRFDSTGDFASALAGKPVGGSSSSGRRPIAFVGAALVLVAAAAAIASRSGGSPAASTPKGPSPQVVAESEGKAAIAKLDVANPDEPDFASKNETTLGQLQKDGEFLVTTTTDSGPREKVDHWVGMGYYFLGKRSLALLAHDCAEASKQGRKPEGKAKEAARPHATEAASAFMQYVDKMPSGELRDNDFEEMGLYEKMLKQYGFEGVDAVKEFSASVAKRKQGAKN